MESYEAYVVPTLHKFKSFGFIHVIPLFSLLKLDPPPPFSFFPLLTLLNLSGVQRKSVQLSLCLLYCQPHPPCPREVCVEQPLTTPQNLRDLFHVKSHHSGKYFS